MTKRAAFISVVVLATALMAATAAAAPPTAAKRAEAQQVLEQIHALDMQVEQAIESYNAANIELDQIQADQAANKRHLQMAKASFRKAEKTLQARLLALYTTGESSTLEILLGATSLTDFLDRADAVNRVSKQDLRIVTEIERAKKEMKKREAELAKAQKRQAAVVDELAAQKASIESQLSERERMLASIKDEIARIEAAEAKRQARLKELAEQRLEQHARDADELGRQLGRLHRRGDAGCPLRGCGRHRDAVPGRPVRLGRRITERLRLLRASSSTSFAQVGVSLPHNAAMQYGYGSPVSRSMLAPGDLVFFNGLGHVGIYIGGGQFIHSPHTGDVVKISSLSDSWYSSTYYGARRL